MDCCSTGEHASGDLTVDKRHRSLESLARFGMIGLIVERVAQNLLRPRVQGSRVLIKGGRW